MDPRQEILLFHVIETFIKTAEPIGSKFLVRELGLDWSEATVRNELRALEEAGYLTHPHTSAGRIPTLAGYRYYINKVDLAAATASKNEAATLEQAARETQDTVSEMKTLARAVVELSHETVLVAFSPDSVYYTGLGNLFQKPDFKELSLVASVSQAFDRCESLLPDFFEEVGTEPKYYLGDEHPFGEMMSALSARFGPNRESLIILLGPQRMNYRRNWGLLQKVLELI